MPEQLSAHAKGPNFCKAVLGESWKISVLYGKVEGFQEDPVVRVIDFGAPGVRLHHKGASVLDVGRPGCRLLI